MKNTDGNVASFRDNFANKLFNKAIKIYELFETNQIPDENLKIELILLLSAIEDLDRENIRERTPSNNKMDRGNDER